MARQLTYKNFERAIRKQWALRFGLCRSTEVPLIDDARSNNYRMTWDSATYPDEPGLAIEALGVDAQDQVRVAGTVVGPIYQPLNFPLDIAVTTRRLFVNPFPWKIKVMGIREVHTVAESTASTLTCYIEKTYNGLAAGTGLSTQVGTFNLKGTANTVQTAVMSSAKGKDGNYYTELEQGQGLSWVISTTATELAGVLVTVDIDTGGKAGICAVIAQDNTRCIDRMVHVANVPKTVTYTACIFGTKAGAAANVMIERLQGTEDEAGGDALITNDTTGFELDGTANTVQYGTLTATAAALRIHNGDRLACDFSGTVTAVRNLCISIGYSNSAQSVEVDQHMLLDAETDNVSRAAFIAGRRWRVDAVREVHGTADSGEDIDVEIDTFTTAPGSGTGVITDDSGNGFDGGATANTVQTGTLADAAVRIMHSGDRLSVRSTDSDDTMLNVCVTALLTAA